MALNKDTLGAALQQVAKDFSDDVMALINSKPKDAKGFPEQPTAAEFEALQLQRWKDFAEALINHFVANAEITPNGTPQMKAGSTDVTGKGKIQ